MVFILVICLLFPLMNGGTNLAVMGSILHVSIQWLLSYPEGRIVLLGSIRDVAHASDHCEVCRR